MDVLMELARIVIAESNAAQTIYLREKGGDRAFPIEIGFAEAFAINQRLDGSPFPRPLTHDLLANTIKALGGRLDKIVINDLRRLDPSQYRQTFIATLYISQDGKAVEVDSRPSDAIAVAVGLKTPIYVAGEVLDAVLNSQPTLEEQVGMLRERMEMLDEQVQEAEQRLGSEEFTAQVPAEVLKEYRRRVAAMKHEREAIRRAVQKLEEDRE